MPRDKFASPPSQTGRKISLPTRTCGRLRRAVGFRVFQPGQRHQAFSQFHQLGLQLGPLGDEPIHLSVLVWFQGA
jgi:hypothetical protein